jgi:hypothetical protein
MLNESLRHQGKRCCHKKLHIARVLSPIAFVQKGRLADFFLSDLSDMLHLVACISFLPQ